MARGQQLSDEERQLLQAQIAQTYGETSAQQQKLQLAAQELALRQQAQQTEAATAQAETARKGELTPYEKLMSLAKMAEPESTERMNTLRSVVDIMGQRERAQTSQAQSDAQMRERQAIIAAQEKDRAAATQGQIQDALISYSRERPDVLPPRALADTLRGYGNKPLADVLDKAATTKEEGEFRAVKTDLSELSGNKRKKYLEGVAPNVRQRLHEEGALPTTSGGGSSWAEPTFQAGQVVKRAVTNLPLPPEMMALGPGGMFPYAVRKIPDINFGKVKEAIKDFYGGLTQ